MFNHKLNTCHCLFLLSHFTEKSSSRFSEVNWLPSPSNKHLGFTTAGSLWNKNYFLNVCPSLPFLLHCDGVLRVPGLVVGCLQSLPIVFVLSVLLEVSQVFLKHQPMHVYSSVRAMLCLLALTNMAQKRIQAHIASYESMKESSEIIFTMIFLKGTALKNYWRYCKVLIIFLHQSTFQSTIQTSLVYFCKGGEI